MPVDEDDLISYQQWGLDFFAEAVSQDRILGAVDNLAGQPIDFGPIGVGPGRIAKVSAHGAIGRASADRIDGELIAYRVVLPVDLTFDLDLQVETHTFHATLSVPLVLTAHAVDGVRIWVQVEPPSARDIAVDVRAEGLRASIMQRVANIEGELRRFVARYVAREVGKPHVESARLIDVSAAIDRAWSAIGPRHNRGEEPATRVTDDLNEALEAELRDNEDAYLDPS